MGVPHHRALASLHTVDPGYPVPAVLELLAAPGNAHLLDYISEDPFGAHVFPGNLEGYAPSDFLADLDRQLADTPSFHLWSYIPTCAYHCRFCQYPVVLVSGSPQEVDEKAARWVDWNIREARLWLRDVPHLGVAPVGELNVFGGTPSLLPSEALRRLLDFYRANFAFTADTTIRLEGDPATFTIDKLELLADLGCTKLSCGVQSFDDAVLHECGRRHTAAAGVDFIRNARSIGFDWISIDLMYGLLDQSLDSVRRDLEVVRQTGPTAVVCTKLHLKSYTDTRTGVAGQKPAAWQIPAFRDRLERAGHRWPSLGEQYQMREVLAEGLAASGYAEHPAAYFSRGGAGPEKWKSLMVDQDKQCPEVAIGLGGSSSCRLSEAITEVSPLDYANAVQGGHIPLGSATGFTDTAQESRSVKMALSSLQPLDDRLHRQRFADRSLFDEPWSRTFRSLQERGLLVIRQDAGQIELTPGGMTLVEAIINTEL